MKHQDTALIEQLRTSSTYGPLWNDPDTVMRDLVRYLHQENHAGAIGWTVRTLANHFLYDDPHAGAGEEYNALARLLMLGQGGRAIA